MVLHNPSLSCSSSLDLRTFFSLQLAHTLLIACLLNFKCVCTSSWSSLDIWRELLAKLTVPQISLKFLSHEAYKTSHAIQAGGVQRSGFLHSLFICSCLLFFFLLGFKLFMWEDCPVGEGPVETAERKDLGKLQQGGGQSWEQSQKRTITIAREESKCFCWLWQIKEVGTGGLYPSFGSKWVTEDLSKSSASSVLLLCSGCQQGFCTPCFLEKKTDFLDIEGKM